MLNEQTRLTIKEMHVRGISLHEISRILDIDRKTLRRVIRGDHPGTYLKESSYCEHLPIIKELFTRCKGNVVRLKEILREEYRIEIPYTSLTRLVRETGLRIPEKKQAGSYTFAPGDEMQHDTSPYKIVLNGKNVTVQCASLVFAYSRKLYIRFYPRFTRFEARSFLTQAFSYMEGTCRRCTIDNTSVLVAYGTGPDAVIAPEVKLLGNIFNVVFVPHAVGHADRKARVERPFGYVNANFLAGRTFTGWNDLNEQALNWCDTTANQKIKRILGISPQQAYVMEKPSLQPLPPYIPPVYVSVYRVVDTQGYISLDTNRYSVPYQLIGAEVEVQKHINTVIIYSKHRSVAEHQRELENKDVKITQPSHRAPYLKKENRIGASKEESMLKGESETLDAYITELKKRSHGRGVVKLRRLLEVKRSYPQEAFYAGIQKALRYGLYDLTRLEDMILSNIAGEFFEL